MESPIFYGQGLNYETGGNVNPPPLLASFGWLLREDFLRAISGLLFIYLITTVVTVLLVIHANKWLEIALLPARRCRHYALRYHATAITKLTNTQCSPLYCAAGTFIYIEGGKSSYCFMYYLALSKRAGFVTIYEYIRKKAQVLCTFYG